VDAETSEAIGTLTARIDALEVSIRSEIRGGLAGERRHADGQFAKAMAHTDEQFARAMAHTDGQFASARAHTNEQFARAMAHTDEQFARAMAHTDEQFALLADRIETVKRHTEILVESVRDDIRILAEGFAALSRRLDSRL
jgi:hypothetical protein